MKDDNFADFGARMHTKETLPGVLDYLLPNFKLGVFEKLVGMVLLPLILIIVLTFIFPPLRVLLNVMLKRII